ncbi:MAG: ribosomal-protein-alanine N-acetyltransferase [Gammaproteobacteria bacterium]|jgi:ribosomal-protein-alanine N-acetyltransferase|tara:strand:+ start:216 stop:785 length:570 start_codon:yes stop_codon:yes gene_type:complete
MTARIKPFREIHNDRISLIALNEKYINDMWEYSKESELYRFLEYDCLDDKKATLNYFKKLVERTKKENCHIWFIQLIDNKKVVGSISAHQLDHSRNSCEIGFAISPNYWGQGIFDIVLSTLVEELFNYYNINRISALTYRENIRCIKSLEKNKFKIEGLLKDYYKSSDNVRHDASLLALTKNSYNKVQE